MKIAVRSQTPADMAGSGEAKTPGSQDISTIETAAAMGADRQDLSDDISVFLSEPKTRHRHVTNSAIAIAARPMTSSGTATPNETAAVRMLNTRQVPGLSKLRFSELSLRRSFISVCAMGLVAKVG